MFRDCVYRETKLIKLFPLNENEEYGYFLIKINNVTCKPLPFISYSPLGACSMPTNRINFI